MCARNWPSSDTKRIRSFFQRTKMVAQVGSVPNVFTSKYSSWRVDIARVLTFWLRTFSSSCRARNSLEPHRSGLITHWKFFFSKVVQYGMRWTQEVMRIAPVSFPLSFDPSFPFYSILCSNGLRVIKDLVKYTPLSIPKGLKSLIMHLQLWSFCF